MRVHSGRLSTARRLRAVVLCSSMVGLVALSARPVLGGPDIAPGPFRPTAESLKQYRYPDWFRDAKLGIWAHWGPQAVPMFGDRYAKHLYVQGHPQYKDHLAHYGHPSKFGYKDIIPLWRAE